MIYLVRADVFSLKSVINFPGPIRSFTIEENNIGLTVSKILNFTQINILLLLYVEQYDLT